MVSFSERPLATEISAAPYSVLTKSRVMAIASRVVPVPFSASPRPGAMALGLNSRISLSVAGHSRKYASPQ